MGYTTDFDGEFAITPGLKHKHRIFLERFNQTRRVKRDPSKLPPDANKDVGLPVGDDGAYYVGGEGFRGQDIDKSTVDSNFPPQGQPGLWCQWVPSEDGQLLEWDGGEKFYCYIEWLEYLIGHFFTPWGYKLNGEVRWQGEDPGDFGKIVLEDSVLTVFDGVHCYTKRKTSHTTGNNMAVRKRHHDILKKLRFYGGITPETRIYFNVPSGRLSETMRSLKKQGLVEDVDQSWLLTELGVATADSIGKTLTRR